MHLYGTISFYITRSLTLYRCKPFLTNVLQTLNSKLTSFEKKAGMKHCRCGHMEKCWHKKGVNN